MSCYTVGAVEGSGHDQYWYELAGASFFGSADAFCDEGATTCPSGFAYLKMQITPYPTANNARWPRRSIDSPPTPVMCSGLPVITPSAGV